MWVVRISSRNFSRKSKAYTGKQGRRVVENSPVPEEMGDPLVIFNQALINTVADTRL